VSAVIAKKNENACIGRVRTLVAAETSSTTAKSRKVWLEANEEDDEGTAVMPKVSKVAAEV
jgi:hypothetical protein